MSGAALCRRSRLRPEIELRLSRKRKLSVDAREALVACAKTRKVWLGFLHKIQLSQTAHMKVEGSTPLTKNQSGNLLVFSILSVVSRIDKIAFRSKGV